MPDFSPFSLFALVLVVAAIILVRSAVKTVPQGFEWTLERFGRYTRTLSPGLHLITPFFDRIGHRISMQETVLEIPGQDVITRDNAMVKTDGVVFFQVVDAAAAVYEVRNLLQAMTNLALTNLRTVIGALDLDEVLSQRDHINERLLRIIDAATHPWGVKVVRIEIKDLVPPADITSAMNRQMKAERERRAAILEAEGAKQAAILRAEGSKQGAILEAEGRREAAFRDAEARERQAEAEAKATVMVSEAIAKGDVNALNYFVAQNYLGALGKLASAPNQRVLILPMEATGILGSLAGITELARSAGIARDSGATPPTRSDPPKRPPPAPDVAQVSPWVDGGPR
jgi:regulator of protease activity HflC (stomatin/prohibitin superfamily)